MGRLSMALTAGFIYCCARSATEFILDICCLTLKIRIIYQSNQDLLYFIAVDMQNLIDQPLLSERFRENIYCQTN